MKLLQDFREKIAAGAGAFDAQDFEQLAEQWQHILRELAENDAFARYPQHLQEMSRSIETLFFSSLARRLMATTDVKTMIDFGKALGAMAAGSERDALIHLFLELLRQPEFLTRISDTRPFETLILDLLKKSHFTVGALLRQRATLYPQKNLFGVIEGTQIRRYSFLEVRQRVDQLARGLLTLVGRHETNNPAVAFLTDNSLEMALLDLACLSSGIVNVMIPANSVAKQIEFVVRQTQVKVLLVGSRKHFSQVNQVRRQLDSVEHIVMVNETPHEDGVLSMDDLIQLGMRLSDESLAERRARVRIEDLATIMYTSGTTGEPKGIMFSQLNIVYKRFCRALALPKIGPEDRFLAYLPLYHTFGRYLEMTGALFWAAEYYFMENPALETMVHNMQMVHPTIFISIPKKWIQLYEYISARIDVETDDEALIRQTVETVTGGQLRWGLSAAGYLDPTIFRFFQRNGVELLSGFGMTEATGGITMTRPGQYVENALGVPLPGIEAKLAPDGELLIRGPYVMMGYYGQKESAFTADGWFPTGDIMRYLKNGYLEIIDRKKEIYKNIRGETIAPQRIEKFFYDFDYVKQVYLVGDNRPFNTVLIYPNLEGADNPLRNMDEQALHEFFSTVVVTVNNFLAPFERIVDFRLIDRPFSAEYGELTPKGTYKRRVIDRNFADVIEQMYRRSFVEFVWNGWTLRLPNWFLREQGYLTQDIRLSEEGIFVEKEQKTLPLHPESESTVRIGRFVYAVRKHMIDLQVLLSNPLYWLGNQEVVDFTNGQVFQWYRIDRPDAQMEFVRVENSATFPQEVRAELQGYLAEKNPNLQGLHAALLHLQSPHLADAERGFAYLKLFLLDSQQPFHDLVKTIISHPGYALSDQTAVRQLLTVLPQLKGRIFGEVFERFLKANTRILTKELIAEIAANKGNDTEALNAIHEIIKNAVRSLPVGQSVKQTAIPGLLELLARIGVEHPGQYKRIRQWLVRYQLRKDCKDLSAAAARAKRKMQAGFRKWIGENQQVSIDVETNEEYRWSDVMIFEEEIPADDRQLLLHALAARPVIRETLFLLGGGILAGLYDIPPGGVWISRLHEERDHTVYRVSVQTRFQGGYDFVINLERKKTTPKLHEEMNWLIHACAPARGIKLVEEFGGFWKEFNLWTEEYIPGDSLERYFSKMTRRNDEETRQRLHYLWPMFIWTGISAHVSFWRRTGYRLEIEDKSIANIMIPPHDYMNGVRIFSIRKRKKSRGLSSLILNFVQQFIKPTEQKYPFVKNKDKWYFIFSGVLDAEGPAKGLEHLRELLQTLENRRKHFHLQRFLREYLREIEEKGFTPRNLYFAIQRYRRWAHLNPEADFSARLFTLNELYETYGLADFESRYPGMRIRFFLETIFEHSDKAMQKKLAEIIKISQENNLSHEDRLKLFSEIRNRFELSEYEEFFLSRLSYPHLQPRDSAGWLKVSGGLQQNDVVVTLEDYDGLRYHVRKPISPKEISRLHKIFLEANLPVVFKPEHRYLIAVSERGYVIGGLFYRALDEQTVHIEKIVVTSKYRRKGISEGLMNEFFNRMRDAKFRFVTTGFFRPEYFYRFGFSIERKYAGLVKDLQAGGKQ